MDQIQLLDKPTKTPDTTSGPKMASRPFVYKPGTGTTYPEPLRQPQTWFPSIECGDEWIIAEPCPFLSVLPEETVPLLPSEEPKLVFYSYSAPAAIFKVHGDISYSWQKSPVFLFFSSGAQFGRLPEVLDQWLTHFGDLPDGWDGYGGRAIDHRAVEKARSILLRAIARTELQLPMPFVSPTAEGGIGLEWRLEASRELLVEVSPEGDVSYLFVVPQPGGGELETEDILEDPAGLDELLRRLGTRG